MTKPILWLFLLALCFAAAPASANCDECKDLCPLIDHYLQKEKGIEIWKKYAASTPVMMRTPLPAGVTETESMENLGLAEFNEWLAERELPCERASDPLRALGLAPQPPPQAQTDLTTIALDPACPILYNGEPFDAARQKAYEDAVGCKDLSDATIAHEQVHQGHCQKAFAEDPHGAVALLDSPEMVAESEFQAWTAHKQKLEEAIRRILSDKGCGWDPTERQKADPHSVPSLKQMQEMDRRLRKTKELLDTITAPGRRY